MSTLFVVNLQVHLEFRTDATSRHLFFAFYVFDLKHQMMRPSIAMWLTFVRSSGGQYLCLSSGTLRTWYGDEKYIRNGSSECLSRCQAEGDQ